MLLWCSDAFLFIFVMGLTDQTQQFGASYAPTREVPMEHKYQMWTIKWYRIFVLFLIKFFFLYKSNGFLCVSSVFCLLFIWVSTTAAAKEIFICAVRRIFAVTNIDRPTTTPPPPPPRRKIRQPFVAVCLLLQQFAYFLFNFQGEQYPIWKYLLVEWLLNCFLIEIVFQSGQCIFTTF